MANTKISHPNNETFFIIWNNERTKIHGYGSILPEQEMETRYSEVDSHLIESEWNQVLLDNGIDNSPIEDKGPGVFVGE